ncbi:MAG: cytochrome c peroxidase [Kiritimatiellia bacterium]|jgi:cytochrome c peroxidase
MNVRVFILLMGLASCTAPDVYDPFLQDAPTEVELAQLRTMWPLPAVPDDPTNAVDDDPWAAHLGQFIYFETRLSSNGEVSCASCHPPSSGWADGERLSKGLGTTGRYAPTVLNSAYNRWQFWDGRCDTLWCQAVGPIEHPDEMDFDRTAVAHLIADDPALSEAYEDVFGELPNLSDAARFPDHAKPDGELAEVWSAMRPEDKHEINVVYSNVGKAIAAFEAQIVMRDAPFDRWTESWLLDEPDGRDALTKQQVRGLKLFLSDQARCFSCHSGPNFSNGEFHNIGLATPEWGAEGDRGRLRGILDVRDQLFNGVGPYSDDPDSVRDKLERIATIGEQVGQFKTPTLRNVELTPPYFHLGHVQTLAEVVQHYGEPTSEPEFGHREELLEPLDLDADQQANLAAFLLSLTGQPLPEALTEQPSDPRYRDSEGR